MGFHSKGKRVSVRARQGANLGAKTNINDIKEIENRQS
jgi:hypothetical protein